MTVIFTTPPGTTLASRFQPIFFAATQDVIAVSVSIGAQQAEERAFRDGAFLYPYLGSTRNGNDFSLVRSEGWVDQRAPTVFVDENETPTGSLAMATLYEVDVTDQPSQSMATAGKYVIDGFDWWAKGAFNGGGTNNLIEGTGLQITKASLQASTSGWRQGGSVPFNERLVAFPLSQLPDYNPLAPLCVLARFAGSPDLGSGCLGVVCGLTDAAASSSALTSAERGTSVYVQLMQPGAAWFGWDSRGNNVVNPLPSFGGASLPMGDVVHGVHRFELRRHFLNLGLWSGSFGQPDDYQAYNQFTVPAVKGDAAASNSPAFFFLIEKPFLGGLDHAYALTHLKVMQPKVAA